MVNLIQRHINTATILYVLHIGNVIAQDLTKQMMKSLVAFELSDLTFVNAESIFEGSWQQPL